MPRTYNDRLPCINGSSAILSLDAHHRSTDKTFGSDKNDQGSLTSASCPLSSLNPTFRQSHLGRNSKLLMAEK